MSDYTKYTFEQLAELKSGTKLHDEFDESIRFIILRGPASLTAYIGIADDHPLADFDYDSIPIDCHGGFTYSRKGIGNSLPVGYWWYGWDYAHAGDACFYDLKSNSTFRQTERRWVLKEVIDDAWDTKYEFNKLMKLVNEITQKVKSCH